MKDPTQSIQDAIYTLLNGNVTYTNSDGKEFTIKVFKDTPQANQIPIVKGKMYHYIEIGNISDTETPNNADTFVHDVTVEVQVIVGFPGMGSQSVVNNIVNQVTQLILTAKGGALSIGSDFTNIIHYLENAFQTTEQDTHKKIIKTLRYRLEIDEN